MRTERIFTSCFQIYRIFSLLTTNPAKIPRNPHTKKTTLQSNVPDELPDSLSSSIFYEKEREYSGFEYLNGDYYLIRHKKINDRGTPIYQHSADEKHPDFFIYYDLGANFVFVFILNPNHVTAPLLPTYKTISLIDSY